MKVPPCSATSTTAPAVDGGAVSVEGTRPAARPAPRPAAAPAFIRIYKNTHKNKVIISTSSSLLQYPES